MKEDDRARRNQWDRTRNNLRLYCGNGVHMTSIGFCMFLLEPEAETMCCVGMTGFAGQAQGKGAHIS